MMFCMRTTLTLDSALLAAARSVADRTDRSIGDVISEWARRGLEAAQGAHRERGFPVFSVSAGAPPISGETVRALLDDEGLPPRR
jgi:hypothetical protein